MRFARSFGIAIAILAVVPTAIAGDHPITESEVRFAAISPFGAASLPNINSRTHRIGNIRLGIHNFGSFGQFTSESCTGLPGSGLEFPAGSKLEYLFVGTLWIGAVKNGDTLVSTGAQNQLRGGEFFPDPAPAGTIIERTNQSVLRADPHSSCPDVFFTPEALSNQDLVAEFFDTVTASFIETDPVDGRRHIPLQLRIQQRSLAWSFSSAQGYFIIDYDVQNIGTSNLKDMYIGVFVNNDIYSQVSAEPDDLSDDVSGFLHTIPSSIAPGYVDTINLAWSADADGDPDGSTFGKQSPTGVAGVRVLRTPPKSRLFSFNWWAPNTEPAMDWGPNLENSKVEFVLGNLGTPEGDRAKYQMMSNGEIDYDQIESAINHQATGWLPPASDVALASRIAQGANTRYLLSFGPAQLKPDSVLSFTIAIIAAQDFHTDPRNFSRFFDPLRPQRYKQGLDFENLGRVAQWAGWSFDVPGVDTNGDGYRGKSRIIEGDTIFYEGDGVPDFQVPPSPLNPELHFESAAGRIVMRWNGQATETEIDPFSRLVDFEGYRIYMSRTGQLNDFVLLAQRDNINYSRRKLNLNSLRWESHDPPFTLDSLKILYDSLSQLQFGHPFHPDSFSVASRNRALLEIVLDAHDPSSLDSNYYAFAAFDANQMVDDNALVNAVLSGLDVTRVIRKLYPNASPSDTLPRNDGTPFSPYYEYEYALPGVSPVEPVFVAVTAFDFGGPAVGVPPRESSPLSNAMEVWPTNSAEIVMDERPMPGVYPNPYRISDSYNAAGWENRRGLEPDQERARQVTFYNVPDTCTVSIWSIDGDLVRKLEHRANPSSSEATVVIWNLITRNTQAVKSGIYIYSIESRFGTDVGKLVIIK